MSKQDRTHSRTPADTENKFLHNLGKTFAEIMGIATDARRTAEGTRSELSKSVAEINKELTDKTAAIELQAKTITKQGENIAELQEKATEQGASIGLLVDNDGVKGSVIVEAINGQSSVKIGADHITFKGKELDLEVDDTHIKGKLTAEVLNIDNIKAENVDISGKITANDGFIGDWVLGTAFIPYEKADGTEGTYDGQSALYSGEQRYTTEFGFNIVETWLTARGVYVRIKRYECTVDEFTGVHTDTTYYEKSWWRILTGGN